MRKHWIAILLSGGLLLTNCVSVLAQDIQTETEADIVIAEENACIGETIGSYETDCGGIVDLVEDEITNDAVSAEQQETAAEILIEEEIIADLENVWSEEEMIDVTESGVEETLESADMASGEEALVCSKSEQESEQTSGEKQTDSGYANNTDLEVTVEVEEEVGDLMVYEASENIVAIDKEHFPDAQFRGYVSKNIDINGDGMLSQTEIESVASINVGYEYDNEIREGISNYNIHDLTGIEYFTGLIDLSCSGNYNLSGLNLSKNTALKTLDCCECGLTRLDLSKNEMLEKLDCSVNELKQLDLSKNVNLIELDCLENDLVDLNVRNCKKLKYISFDYNRLVALDFGNNTEVEWSVNYNYDTGDPQGQEIEGKLIPFDGGWKYDLKGLVGENNLKNVGNCYGYIGWQNYTTGYIDSNGYILFKGQTMPSGITYEYHPGGLAEKFYYVTCYVDCEHIFGKWSIIQKATVLEEGTQTRSCSFCGYEETESVPRLKPSISVNVNELLLKVKQSTTKVKVSGLAKGDSVASWKSSNTKIVKVSSTGKITAQNKTGKAVITVTLASGKTAEINVTVQKSAVKTTKVSGLSSRITLKKGSKKTLKPIITPISSQEKVTYKTSNKKVADVSSKGVITAKTAGKAKITVASGKKSFTVNVTVPSAATRKIGNIKSKITIKKGKSYTLKPELSPSYSTEKVTYTSSDKRVAAVNSQGKITGKKKGTAKITVKSGKVKVVCKVTVK